MQGSEPYPVEDTLYFRIGQPVIYEFHHSLVAEAVHECLAKGTLLGVGAREEDAGI